MTSSTFTETLTARHGFTDLTEIGRGGMGVVFRAWDPKLQRHVAVKQLSTELLDAEAGRRRFESEMVTLGRINHSAVVKIHFADITDDGDAYFVMDYIAGDDLGSLLRQRREWGLRFTVQETVELLRPIASALDFLHLTMNPPIVHRDVKPGNILVPSGAATEAKSLLTDFGISLSAEDTRITSLSMMIGTEKYYAPELFPGGSHSRSGVIHNTPTAASDNYALSLIAFEMLSLQSLKDTMTQDQWGRPERPFPSFTQLGLNKQDFGDAEGIERIFRKALAPVPAYRFPTATAFITELAKTGNQPAASHPPKPPTAVQASATTALPAVAGSSGRRGTGVMIAASAVIAVLAGLLGAGIWFAVQHPAWGEDERPIAQEFPGIIPRFRELDGWRGLTCTPGTPEGDVVGRIDCFSKEHSGGAVSTVSILDHGTNEARERSVPADAELIHWANDRCEAKSVPLPESGDGEPVYMVLPETSGTRFSILITGTQAEEQRFQVPLC